jgi:Kef-type K+ transport system membrane component KefB
LAPSRIVDLGDDELLTKLGVIAIPWPLFGVIGGLAIDRRWGKRIVHGAALSIFSTAIVYELLLYALKIQTFNGEMVSHLSVALGWGLALIVCSASRTLMPE